MRLKTINNLKRAKAPGINALQERLAIADELIEWDWLLPVMADFVAEVVEVCGEP